MTTRVGIVFGGANSEHEVSCASARSIAANLDPVRFSPVLIGIDRRGEWHRVTTVDELGDTGSGARLPDLSGVDVVFPALHGRHGEDGSVQGMLEVAGMPYVGCGVLSSAVAMDKAMTGSLLQAAGIPTPATRVVTASTVVVAADFRYPLFVKPNRAGSSVGASRVERAADLDAALALALAEDSTALVQALQAGDEIDIGVLQRVDGSLAIAPALRVHPAAGSAFFDYAAKYSAGGVEFEVPAAIDQATVTALEAATMTAFRALGCDGLARVDFFVSGESFVLNEVNTMPGMTALSQFPRMWHASGVDYPELLSALLDRAVVAVR